MKNMTKGKGLWIVLTIAFMQMVVLFTPCSTQARAVYWVQGGDGQWNAQTWILGFLTWSNWHDAASSWPYYYTVPQGGDAVYATADGSQPSMMITYDVTGSPLGLIIFSLTTRARAASTCT